MSDNNKMQNIEDILSRSVSGFHQYILSAPPRLNYVSRNLCGMTGFFEDELIDGERDGYGALVHPADRKRFTGFLRELGTEEQTLTAEYRIVKKDGGVLYVSDTSTSRYLADGTMTADSVLTDITRLKEDNDNLRFLNETIPCGFLKYTCEKQPKITYINERMRRIFRFPEVREGEMDYLELCRENIFLLVPMEDRHRFASYLDRVYAQGAPLAGEMTVLRCDGTKAHLFGWVAKCVDDRGREEFQSVCMDVTERYRKKKAGEEKQYLKALTDVYDLIFEYEPAGNTVKCLHSRDSAVFRQIENIPMQMEDATERWIAETVAGEDQDRVREFFGAFYQGKYFLSDARPPQIRYRARSSEGRWRIYRGIFLKMNASSALFCCRRVPDSEEADLLRDENTALKENMQELILRFTDGLAAFEVLDDYVTPLYASDNVCEFFGFTREEWLSMMKKSTPLRSFVSRSAASYEDFAGLLEDGEAEFAYYDLDSGTERRIKAICSRKSPGGHAPRYVMLYSVDGKKGDGADGSCKVRIRTFGYFDVFVDDRPIAFRNKKSKELFALLVDRRGGYVSSEEAIGFLWEEEPVSSVTLARYRKVALRLKNILAEYGISDVVETVDGKRRIVTDKVKCDLYDYLSGREEYSRLFMGSYLTNYSWGENTLAELAGISGTCCPL
ncbi:MAG TPA: hypothetical protein DF613_10610 [Lachnospiraceae bacterium]|nr:hypothetical protein [Lachnospiraceae bacterium]